MPGQTRQWRAHVRGARPAGHRHQGSIVEHRDAATKPARVSDSKGSPPESPLEESRAAHACPLAPPALAHRGDRRRGRHRRGRGDRRRRGLLPRGGCRSPATRHGAPRALRQRSGARRRRRRREHRRAARRGVPRRHAHGGVAHARRGGHRRGRSGGRRPRRGGEGPVGRAHARDLRAARARLRAVLGGGLRPTTTTSGRRRSARRWPRHPMSRPS